MEEAQAQAHMQAHQREYLMEYLGNDQLASQCFNERSMILRDKDENSSQEKEASESEENVKNRKARENPWKTKGVGEECSFPQGHSTRRKS